ncbi:MAG: hypothetical protein L3J75_15385 [Methylococcaceae bacterium]|nr:hypothetical protein [Methylococcaceae bacterium]
MIKNVFFASFIVLFSLNASSSADEKNELVTKIVKASGIELIIESIPEQFEAQKTQRRTTSRNPEIDDLVTKIFIENFNESLAKEQVHLTIFNKIDLNNLKKIVVWLDSPLGQRFSSAEVTASSPNAEADLLRYLADLQTSPPSQDRIALFQTFEKAAGLTDSAVSIFESLMRTIISGIRAITPESEGVSEEKINSQIGIMIPILRQGMWQKMIAMSHFTYQEFTNEEVNEYIAFLNSNAGKQFSNIAVNVVKVIYDDMIKRSLPKLIETAEKQKKSSSTKNVTN